MTLTIRRTAKKSGRCVCFRHAILIALSGNDVGEEIDVFGLTGNDMMNTICYFCDKEKETNNVG